jgi:hypothetical protein
MLMIKEIEKICNLKKAISTTNSLAMARRQLTLGRDIMARE